MSNPPKNLGRGPPPPLFGNAMILRAPVIPRPPFLTKSENLKIGWHTMSTAPHLYKKLGSILVKLCQLNSTQVNLNQLESI